MAASSLPSTPNAPAPNAPAHDLGASLLDDVLMALLSLISVLLLVFELVSDQNAEQMRVLELADALIAGIFFTEFWVRFYKAPQRAKFFKKHWWELLAAIPLTHETTQFLRSLNLLRVVRIIRLLRLIRFLVRLKILLDASQRLAKQSYLIYVFTVLAMILAGGTLGFHYMEVGQNPNVKTLFDSFWWTVVTLTTVGYGDIYPVTMGGRILAIFLMLGGVAVVSAITAFGAAAILREKNRENCE